MARIRPIPVTLRDGRVVTLRTAEAADADASLALLLAVAEEKAFTLLEPDEVQERATGMPKRLRDAAKDPNTIRLIAVKAAREDGAAAEVVGDLTLQCHKFRRMAHTASVGMEVRGDYRRVGLGDAMMKVALEWARAHPAIERVELGVFAENTGAIALYRKHGFQQEGYRVRMIRLAPGRHMDDIAMALFVKART